jgi:hypothetical protein
MSPKLLNILLVIVPIVLYIGYIDPVYTGASGLIWTPEKSIFALKSENVQYANTLKQVSLVEDEMNKIYKDYQSVGQATTTKALMLLPDRIDAIKLRSEVLAIANKTGVAIDGLNITEGGSKSVTDKDLGYYTVTFSTKARYPVFKVLMSNYEKNLRFFYLESASLIRPDKDKTQQDVKNVTLDDGESLDANVIFKVHYLK